MRRRPAIIAGLCAAVLAIAVTGAWFYFVHQTQRAIIRWADLQRQSGTEITWQSLRFSGFPLRVDARIGAPQVVIRRPDREAVWQPSAVTFRFSSISPEAIGFFSPGAQALHITSAGKTWSAAIDADIFEGHASFPPHDYRRIEEVAGRFAGVRLKSDGADEPLTVERGTFAAAHRPVGQVDPAAIHPQGVSLEASVRARNIRVPANSLQATAAEVLGSEIAAVAADIQVTGDLDPRSVDTDTLARWRDSGGTLEIATIDVQWGPVRLTADGTMALDSNLQPEGAFVARIAGLDRFVSALESAGAMSPNDAAVARITLAVLTRPSADGGPDRAEIPVTLQDRILRLGPIALIELPLVVWH